MANFGLLFSLQFDNVDEKSGYDVGASGFRKVDCACRILCCYRWTPGIRAHLVYRCKFFVHMNSVHTNYDMLESIQTYMDISNQEARHQPNLYQYSCMFLVY